LAFPSNDYHQELGSNEEIQSFVSKNFPQVTFPLFGLTSLKENVVYQRLGQQQRRQHSEIDNNFHAVRQNFFKVLLDRKGMVVKVFSKKEDPFTLAEYIARLLDDSNMATHHHDSHNIKLVTH